MKFHSTSLLNSRHCDGARKKKKRKNMAWTLQQGIHSHRQLRNEYIFRFPYFTGLFLPTQLKGLVTKAPVVKTSYSALLSLQ